MGEGTRSGLESDDIKANPERKAKVLKPPRGGCWTAGKHLNNSPHLRGCNYQVVTPPGDRLTAECLTKAFTKTAKSCPCRGGCPTAERHSSNSPHPPGLQLPSCNPTRGQIPCWVPDKGTMKTAQSCPTGTPCPLGTTKWLSNHFFEPGPELPCLGIGPGSAHTRLLEHKLAMSWSLVSRDPLM